MAALVDYDSNDSDSDDERPEESVAFYVPQVEQLDDDEKDRAEAPAEGREDCAARRRLHHAVLRGAGRGARSMRTGRARVREANWRTQSWYTVII